MSRQVDFAFLLAKSRTDAGKTQRQIAKLIGKSVATIQNWEAGLSCPSYLELEDWFEAIGLNMHHYVLQYKYPNLFKDSESDVDVESSLIEFIRMQPHKHKRQLAFLLFGQTGSDPIQQLNMYTANNHTSMRSRCQVAQLIVDNYRIEEARGELRCTESVMPDIESLLTAIEAGKKSAYTG